MQKNLWFAILVSALGYFVDVYDIILFSVVRVPSLQSLGVPPEKLVNTGLILMNLQLLGMLLGGLLWGILGDKRGRFSILFCSLLGFGSGYWPIFLMIASEQFGTNLRATATTSLPNFVRGAIVPISANKK